MDMIAFDILKKQGISVGPSQNIIFDDILLQKGAINYDLNTGVITINKKGRYLVSWDVATQSAIGSQAIQFAIVVSNGIEIVTGSPAKNGEIVGFGIIQIDTAPVTLSIVNYESVDVYYSVPTATKAHLSIGELAETTGSQPVVWESAGVQLMNNHPLPTEQLNISSGATIPFDNITVQFNGVYYANNAIEIIETGTYLITWNITAKAANGTSAILVYLEDEIGNIYGKSGMYGGTLAPTTGSSLVQIQNIPMDGPFKLRLVNRTDGDVILASIFNGPTTTTDYFAGSLSAVKVADVYYT